MICAALSVWPFLSCYPSIFITEHTMADQALNVRSRPGETSGRVEAPCNRPFRLGIPKACLQSHRAQAQLQRSKRCVSRASDTKGVTGSTDTEQIDVSSIFVDTAFRATPWEQERIEERSRRTQAQILFVSESNVCRSVLAQAVMDRLILERGMQAEVRCESKGTRDYNVGEGPEALVQQVAQEEGLQLPAGFQARQLKPETDIVAFDMVLVMDKFTAADVLREVSVFDSINSQGGYSRRVRRLGEFHPTMSTETATDAQDLDDPLYGNANDETEKEAVRASLGDITEACEGLMGFLEELHRGSGSGCGGGSLRSRLSAAVQDMESVDWLVPPMLQKR